jgi:uncharacterized protein (DUF302 family)
MMPVRYAVDSRPIDGQWTARSTFDFEETLSKLRQAINDRELWLIGEIDPRSLLMKAGMDIHPARQLLFFHPRFMTRLLQADARAVPEIPLKIVVMADAAGVVYLRGPAIGKALDRYAGARQLGEELAALCAEIVMTVSVGLRPV